MPVRKIRAMDCDGYKCDQWAEVPASQRAASFVPYGWTRVIAREHTGAERNMVFCPVCAREAFPPPVQDDLIDALEAGGFEVTDLDGKPLGGC